LLFKFHDHLPEDLKTKYFDFKFRDYPNDDFCKDLLKQINLSYDNCKYYKDKLCKKFDYKIPDDISIDNLETIPYIPTDTYKKSGNRTLKLSHSFRVHLLLQEILR